ncbi:hypothetical protein METBISCDRAFT_23763 [Metschnikowia bicuspidata]|uniref:Uncharacterized protein n=1 Tax=Metschnikowia bicuspidata TaxID=27322 RepID=A0A4P9ZDG3_9ASCO|nr:hypothetical protein METBISCDRAFT_23763 [Metschnikowia bicuspidata]
MSRQSFLVPAGARNPRAPYIKDPFPMLRKQEITDTFWAMGYPVSREQLDKPTPEFMQKFVDFWADEILNFSPTDMDNVIESLLSPTDAQPRDGSAHAAADLENMLPATKLMVQLKASKHLMTKVAIHDFSLMDLLRPEAERVLRFLSAIINFVRFRDEQMVQWKDTIDEVALAHQKVNEIDGQVFVLKNDVARSRETLEVDVDLASSLGGALSRSPRWIHANQLNDDLRAEVTRLLDLSYIWQDKLSSLRVAINQKYERLVALEQLVASLEEETKRLQVYSQMDPSEIGKVSEKLRGTLRVEEEELRLLDATEKNMAKTIQAMKWVEDQLVKLIKTGQVIIEGLKAVEHSREQVPRSRDELNIYKNKLERALRQEENVEQKLKAAEDSLRTLQETVRRKEDEVQERQNKLYAEYDKLSSLREDHQKELDAIKKENDEISGQTAYLNDQYHQEYSEALDELTRLNLLIRDYISEMKPMMS